MRKRRASQLFITNTHHRLLVPLAALTLCPLRGTALAQICNATTNWTDANGSWFVDGNWNNHVPNSSTNAYIGNTGTANIGSAESADACDLFLGFGATESGTVSVNSGRLTVGNELEVVMAKASSASQMERPSVLDLRRSQRCMGLRIQLAQ